MLRFHEARFDGAGFKEGGGHTLLSLGSKGATGGGADSPWTAANIVSFRWNKMYNAGSGLGGGLTAFAHAVNPCFHADDSARDQTVLADAHAALAHMLGPAAAGAVWGQLQDYTSTGKASTLFVGAQTGPRHRTCDYQHPEARGLEGGDWWFMTPPPKCFEWKMLREISMMVLKQTAAETDASADGVDVDANSELAAMAREQAELEAIAEQRKMERKKANATKLEAKRLSLERARRAAAEAEAAADAEAAEELAAIEREEARLKAAAAKTAAASKASKTDAEADASAPKKKRGLFGGLIGGKGRTTKAKAKAAKTKGAKAKGAKAKGAKVASKEESFEFEIQNVHVAHVNLGGGAAVYVAVDNFDVRLLLFVGHGFALHGGGGLALFCIVVALTHPLPLRSTHPLRSCTAVSRSRLSPLINLILYGLFPQSTPTSTA